MSRKKILDRFTMFPSSFKGSNYSGDSSSNFTGPASQVDGLDKLVYELTAESTVAGSMFVEVAHESELQNAEWKRLNFSQSTYIDGSIETEYRFEILVSFKWARMSWENDSGSGIITGFTYGNTVGA